MLTKNALFTLPKHLIAGLCLAFMLSACGGGGSGGAGESFGDVINNAGDYQEEPTKPTNYGTFSSFGPEEQRNGTAWICRNKTVTLEDNPDEFILSRAASVQGIYPGALLQGSNESLKEDPPRALNIGRGPGTVLINLQTGLGDTSVDVPVVNAASIQDAVNTLVAEQSIGNIIPAQFSYKATRVESTEELRIAMSMKTDAFAAATTKFNIAFETDTSKEHWVIKLIQPFYTVSFIPPGSDSGWFADSVTPADLAAEVGPGNPPVYVSSVTYGRIVYLVVTTDASRSEVEASMSVSSAVTSGAVSTNYISTLKDVHIEAVVYGGVSDIAALTGDSAAATGVFTAEQNIATALPISYTIKDVRSNQSVKVKMGGTFTVEECVRSAGVSLDYLPRQILGTTLTPGQTSYIKTGDFNNDQKKDLLFSQIQTGIEAQWQVATSAGDGTFLVGDGTSNPKPKFSKPLGSGPTTIHVADFSSSDDYDDAILETRLSNGEKDLTVVANDTNGGFDTASTLGTYVFCSTVPPHAPILNAGNQTTYIGRFNDSSTDSLDWNVLNNTGWSVVNVTAAQLVGNTCSDGRPGLFSDQWSLSSGSFPDQPVLVGDVNGDGLDDMIVASVNQNGGVNMTWAISRPSLSPLVSGNSGNFDSKVKNGSWEQAIGDVNSDGRADVVLVSSKDEAGNVPTILVFLGQADGTFDFDTSTLSNLGYPDIDQGHYSVLAANMDNTNSDTETLLLYKAAEPNNIFALRGFNNSTRRFDIVGQIRHENPLVDFSDPNNPKGLSKEEWAKYKLTLLDANGDNRDDVLWIRESDGTAVYTGLTKPPQ